MFGTAMKWGVTTVLVLGASVASWLLATGVPKPAALRTEDLGRVSWKPLLNNLAWFDRLHSKRFAAWMPDGSGYLVFASQGVDTRVHRVQAPGGRLEALPNIPTSATGFHGDPGDHYLITSWDSGGNEQEQLFRWDLDDDEPVPLTPAGEKSAFGATEPNGPRIAYSSNRRNGRDFDVYVMDPWNPSTDERVLEVEGSWSVEDWAASANRLLLIHATSNTENQLFAFDVDTEVLEALGEAGAQHVSPTWSRDGQSLYYGSNRDTEFLQLRRFDLATAEETVLSAHIDWDVASIQESADGGTLLVEFNEGGRPSYVLANAESGEFERLDPAPAGLTSMRMHPVEPTVMVNHNDARGIARAYAYDLRSGRLVLWAGRQPAEPAVPDAQLIHYPTFDYDGDTRRRIPAFVYPGVGEGPRPVTISVHGGPESQAKLATVWGSAQRQGITVIAPNVRGSTGYGRTYERLDNGMLREDAVRDIGALLDWIEEQPDLDASRVSIVGGSYGGYMVLASLVHYSDRIRCGIDRVGVSNFVTFLENTADYRRDLRRAEYGDERIPEMREFLHSISPLTHADRITSRLMVVQGANDPRVPLSEALQLVEKVRANGQPVPYIEAADEGHGFKKPWNSLYTFVAEQELLAECLSAD